MQIGISLSLSSQLLSSSGTFTPAELFTSGETGAWYDVSDLSAMFQDAAGTIPAVEGQPVGRVNDKSGRGNHLTQVTTAAKPILRQDYSGGPELVTNGTFTTDTTGWTALGGATLAIVSGALQITVPGSPGQGASQNITGLTIGNRYRVRGTIASSSVTGHGRLRLANGGSGQTVIVGTGPTAVDLSFVATATDALILLEGASGSSWSAAGTVITFDNISLVEQTAYNPARYYLEGDGVDDTLVGPSITINSPAYVIAAGKKIADGATATNMNLFGASTGTNYVVLHTRLQPGIAILGASSRFNGADVAGSALPNGALDVTLPFILEGDHGASGMVAFGKDSAGTSATGSVGVNTVTAANAALGAFNSAPSTQVRAFYGGVYLGRAPTANEKAQLRTFIGANAGVTA